MPAAISVLQQLSKLVFGHAYIADDLFQKGPLHVTRVHRNGSYDFAGVRTGVVAMAAFLMHEPKAPSSECGIHIASCTGREPSRHTRAGILTIRPSETSLGG
jgi:hypothetical protein